MERPIRDRSFYLGPVPGWTFLPLHPSAPLFYLKFCFALYKKTSMPLILLSNYFFFWGG